MNSRFAITFHIAVSSLLALSLIPAYAQTVPDSGRVLRETASPAQSPPPARDGVKVLSPAAPQSGATQGERLAIAGIRITGNTVFFEVDLLALVADVPGTTRTVAELNEAAARITAHYRAAGYLVARAYLPAQKLEAGTLTIVVLEGKLTKLNIDNTSRLSDAQVDAMLGGIEKDAPAQESSINRAVLQLWNTPGVGTVDASLSAGEGVGETNLNVSLLPMSLVSGRIDADNHGGLYTGRNRLGVSADLNSPLGFGERFSARVMGSNDDLLYGRLAGQMPVGGDGWTLGAAVGHTTYELGNTFAALDAVGRSTTGEVFARYPLLRSTSANVYVQPGFEYRKLHDEIRSTSTTTDKYANVAMLNLSADVRDGWLGGGAMQGSVTFSGGRLSFDSSDAEALDAMGARTAGSYNKVLANAERQQYVVANLTLVGQLRGQWSDSNLDSSEKLTLGGPNGVRAYATSEAAGDRGWLATLELRYGVAPWLTLAAFYDAGKAWVNTDPYLATPNALHRRGSGVGISGGYADFDWRAYAAWREDEVGTAEPDKRPRYWLQAGWRF